ncbi:MAG: ArnT family glycosyltransferase [Thermoplasmatota archaeon]
MGGKKEAAAEVSGRTKAILDKLLNSRHSNRYLAFIILLIAMIPRVFYISIGVLPNGVDEGVDIMAGRMWNFGSDLYSQINTVQAPLMLSVYGLIEADPVIFRLFSTACSLVIIAFVMWVGNRIGGRNVMVASGVFMAMDLMFLHESRFASLDVFCLLWVAIGIAFLVKFRQSGSRRALLLMGAALAIASMIKLFGVIATGVIGLILLYDLISDWSLLRKFHLRRFIPPRRIPEVMLSHLVLYTLSWFLVVLLIMTRYGILNVIEGVLLNQLHRPTSPLDLRMSIFGLFILLNIGAIPFIPFGVKGLYRRPEGVILVISVVYLLWFLFQSTTWTHHLIFLSPVTSLCGGIGIMEATTWWSRRRRFRNMPDITRKMVVMTEVILVVLAAMVGGGFTWFIKERGVPIETQASEVVMELTDEGDYVVSGDPIVVAMAEGRLTPDNLVNVAMVQYPMITDDELNGTCIRYGVEVVVLAYHLDEMKGFLDFVEGNYTLRARIVDHQFFLDNIIKEYRIYYLPIDAELRNDPEWRAALGY